MTQPPESGKSHTDARRAFLDAVGSALDDYDATTTAATAALLAEVAGDEPPHVSQLAPKPSYDATPAERRTHKLAALRFATAVLAVLPIGVEPDISVSSVAGRIRIQMYAKDGFELHEADAFARRLGLRKDDNGTTRTDTVGNQYHEWITGDDADSPLDLTLVIAAEAAE